MTISLLGPVLPIVHGPVGGKLYTYESGTTTPLATYTTAVGDVANSNPIILDANGQAVVFCKNQAYTFLMTDANDVVVAGYPVDNINPGIYATEIADIEADITSIAADLAVAETLQTSIVADIEAVETGLSTKAALVHTHTAADITGLTGSEGGPPTGSIFSASTTVTSTSVAKYLDFLGGTTTVITDYNFVDKFFERVTDGLLCKSACNVLVFVCNDRLSVNYTNYTTTHPALVYVHKNGAPFGTNGGICNAMVCLAGDKIQIQQAYGYSPVGNNVITTIVVIPQPVIPT